MSKLLAFLVLFPLMVHAAEPLDKVVAVVNNSVITASELESHIEIFKQQIAARKMPLPPENVMRKQILQHLIDEDLQLQLAKQNGISIADKELDEEISKIAVTNNITLTIMRGDIERSGMSWKAYRENIRKEILLNQLQQKAVGKEVMVSPQQVEEYLKTAQHEDKSALVYHLQNIVVPLPEEPTTDQLKKASAKVQQLLVRLKKGEDFSQVALVESSGEFALEGGDLGARHLAELPDIFASAAVKMHAGQVVGPLRAANGLQLLKLIAVSGDNQKHDVVKTHVRHILVKQAASMTPAEADRQAHNLYQQLKSGKDFAVMAKQYSVDLVSAAKGGDLGWISPGEVVPQFEKAMDSLPLHKVSKPVKSVFGWHIIEVLERKKVDDSASFKRQQVRRFLHQKKFAEAVLNWQQHLRMDAYVKIMDKELA